MKRLFAPALLSAVLLAALVMAPTRADITVGYPSSYTLVQDLNAVGLSATAANIQNAGQCQVTIRGTFVGTVDVYTSVAGTFSDAVKQGSFTAPGLLVVGISALAPNPPTAIRVQNRAYTSGDPWASVDCQGGLFVNAAVAEPTPTSSP